MFLTRLNLGVCAAWLCVLCLTMGGCSSEPEPTEILTPSVKVHVVGDQALGQQRVFSGQVEPISSSVLSFAVSGTVEKVLVEVGAKVEEGQILAQLDAKDYEIATSDLRNQVTVASSTVRERQLNYDRLEELRVTAGIAQSDVDKAEAELNSAKGTLESARNNLKRAERDLERTTLTAPFSGVIAERSIEPFQEVAASQELFVIQGETGFQVSVLVPESLIHEVEFGQGVTVTFPNLDDVEIAGSVSEIASQLESGNAFPVKVTLAESDPGIRAGISSSVVFDLGSVRTQQVTYIVPLSALILQEQLVSPERTPGEPAPARVYRFNPESSTVQEIEIMIGRLRNNEFEVFDGLERGDQIVSTGVSFLSDGMQVRVWNSGQDSTRG